MSEIETAFTTDWVNAHQSLWHQHLAGFANKPGIRALEIGSWEGRSACWFCEHILTGEHATLDCVDPWTGFVEQEARFDRNTKKYAERVRKHKAGSFRWCTEKNLESSGGKYDFIYIDGSHEAQDLLNDLVLCWPLLRSGGIMICDDYDHIDPALRRLPKLAIDGFFNCRTDWILLHKAAQFIVRKIDEREILVEHRSPVEVTKPLKTRVHWGSKPHIRPGLKDGQRGVLTSASSPYWLTLKLQVRACHEAHVDLAVADQGLLSWQVEWLVDHGVTVLAMPEDTQAYQEQANFDLAWDKPAICLTSPFEETIWIDADAVLLRNAELLFDYLQKGPWVSLENFVSEIYARKLYLRMAHRIFGPIPSFYAEATRVNTGVFAFRRGDQWIKDWAAWCDRILADPVLKSECYLHDQHALVALLCDPMSSDRPEIHEDRGLNCPANNLNYKQATQRKQYLWDADDCLERLRNDHPKETVVHWLGRPKPLWGVSEKGSGHV
ncbi:MAG: class I SAM-dependent methyltransferase [Planctomycetaceae bacterium]